MSLSNTKDQPSWLHRVEEDEMRTLIRASANYARQGHDPSLALMQKKAANRDEAEAHRASSMSPEKARRQRKFENDYLGAVPTHYKNFATGRTLTTELPSARPNRHAVRPISQPSAELVNATKQAALQGYGSASKGGRKADDALLKAAGLGHHDPLDGLHPSRIPLTQTAQTTFRSIDQQTVVVPAALGGGHGAPAHAKSMTAAGVSRAALAALEDTTGEDGKVPKPSDVLKRYKMFDTRAEDGGMGPHMVKVMMPEGRHSDKPAMPVGPGTIVAENRAALNKSGTVLNMHPAAGALPANTPGLPAGVASHAILQNRMGKAGATPAPLPRGGSGLVVGDLLVMHDQLVPATLVASKWGRVANTTYTDIPGQPNKIAVEVQPLYYESFLLDLHAVLDRSGGFTFEPLVSPGAFVVDFGRVNAHVHGAPRPEPLPSKAGQALLSDIPQGKEEAEEEGGEEEGPRSPRGGLGDTVFSAGDVALAAKRGKHTMAQDDIRASKQRLKARNKHVKAKEPTHDDVLRAELSMAIDNSKEKAARLLMQLAKDGNDTAIEKLLKDGLKVDFTPDPWYVKKAEMERQKTAAAKKTALTDGEGPPPLEGGGGHDGRASPNEDALGGGSPSPKKPKPGSAGGTKQKDIFVTPQVDMADDHGNTPIMIAAKHGWIDAVLVLLKLGADHKRRNFAGQSAFDLAKAESNMASMALAAELPGAAQRKRRAAKLVSMLDDRTVLVCAQKGDMKRLAYLVDDCDHPVNQVNGYGMTPLHFAVLRKDYKMARFLVERSANINARNNLGQSPLALTLEMDKAGGQAEMLKALNAVDAHALADLKAIREAEEAAMKRQKDEEELVAKLKTYTKGTSAAKAVYAALGSVGKAGAHADFSASASGHLHGQGSGHSNPVKNYHAPALAKTIGLTITPGRPSSSGPQGSGSPHGKSLNLGPLKYTPITKGERTGLMAASHGVGRRGSADAALMGPSQGLAESWNRHTLNYIAVAEKQQFAGEAKAKRIATDASDLAMSEIRRGKLNPAHADDFVAGHTVKPPKYTGGVSASAAASDPTAMIKADKGLRNVPVPNPDSARFEAWARMRFGIA